MTYVGLDVHDETITAAWKRPQGDLRWMKVSHDEEGLERLQRELWKGSVWAAYETSGVGFVPYDRLTEMGWKVSVLATTRMPKSVKGKKRKTDLEDAKQILDVLMAHGECGTELPDVWIPPVGTREDREVERHRLHLGQVVGRIKTRIKSLLKVHGVKCPWVEKTPWTRKYRAWVKGLSTPEGGLARSVGAVLASEWRMLEAAESEVKEMDREMGRLCEQPNYGPAVKAMTEIKGVGALTALVFLLELGDVKRFASRQQVGCYMGLTPTSHESGQAENRKGHITRMGPSRVRLVLNQAAWAFLRSDPYQRAWYEPLKKRAGGKKALVALMRRLGILMWHRACDAIVA